MHSGWITLWSKCELVPPGVGPDPHRPKPRPATLLMERLAGYMAHAAADLLMWQHSPLVVRRPFFRPAKIHKYVECADEANTKPLVVCTG